MKAIALARIAVRNARRLMADLKINVEVVKPVAANVVHLQTRKAPHEVCAALTPVFGAASKFSRDVSDYDRVSHAVWDLPYGKLMVFRHAKRTQVCFIRKPTKITKFGVKALKVFDQVTLGGCTIVSDGRAGDSSSHCCYVRNATYISIILGPISTVCMAVAGPLHMERWSFSKPADAIDFAIALAKIGK